MTPGAIGVAKQVLAELRSDDLRALARRILRLPTVDEIERELLAALGRLPRRSERERSSRCETTMTRVEKPWGYELHWAKTDRYVGKLIHVNAGHALSLQYHNLKDETIYLHSGKLLFEIQEGDELVEARDAAGRARAHHAEDRSTA